MSYTELTVWTRGIIMDKEGRDIVNSIAASARNEGKFSQAMENYVDNPDRTNAPTRKYLRVSDSEIENALTYENEHPNIVELARRAEGFTGADLETLCKKATLLAIAEYQRGARDTSFTVRQRDFEAVLPVRLKPDTTDSTTDDSE